MNLKDCKEKIKEILPKAQILIILLILLLIIIGGFSYYQYSSTIPKKININEQIEKLSEEFKVEDINERKKLITCKINEKYLPEKEYNNYVIGKGTAREVDINIIIKTNGTYYKAKTLQQSKDENGIITLVACVRTRFLLDDYEILLYDNEQQKLYEYVGGKGEENI